MMINSNFDVKKAHTHTKTSHNYVNRLTLIQKQYQMNKLNEGERER